MEKKSYEAAIVNPKEAPQKSYEAAFVSPAGNKFGDKLPNEIMEDIGVSMLQGGTARLADDAVGLVDEEAGNAIKDAHTEAQKRSPVTSFVAETVGEQVNPITKAGSLRKNILLAMTKAFGSSEDKLDSKTAGAMALAGGSEIAVDVGLKALKIPFANQSKTLRARVAGAGTTEFKDVGVNDRELIAERIHKLDFFKSRPVQFDLNTMKFETVKSNVPLVSKPTSQKLRERADEALKVINPEYNRIIDNAAKNHEVPLVDIVSEIEDVVREYTTTGARLGRKVETYENLAEELYNDLFRINTTSGAFVKGMPALPPEALHGGMDVRKVANWKKGLQDEATYGRDSLIKETPEIESFFSELSFRVNNLLSNAIPDKRLRDLGMKQHDLMIVKKDLASKIARQKATGVVNVPSLLQSRQGSYLGQKLMETLPMGSTDEGFLLRAGVQDAAGKIPEPIQDFGRQLAEGLPRQVGQMFAPKENGRSPQSVPNIPEQLLKMKLPRTVEGILQNKNVVLAKVAQQDPNFYHLLKEILDERPDELGDLLPKLVASTPTAFERDPYNRVDNKIQDQASKMKAINDTMRRDDLNNTTKISIINNLNKTGEFLDYQGDPNADN